MNTLSINHKDGKYQVYESGPSTPSHHLASFETLDEALAFIKRVITISECCETFMQLAKEVEETTLGIAQCIERAAHQMIVDASTRSENPLDAANPCFK